MRSHKSSEAPGTWHPERFERLAIRAVQKGLIGKAVVAKYLEVPYAEVETWTLVSPMGKKPRLVLLDAGAVIHAHKCNAWSHLSSRYEVVVPQIISVALGATGHAPSGACVVRLTLPTRGPGTKFFRHIFQ